MSPPKLVRWKKPTTHLVEVRSKLKTGGWSGTSTQGWEAPRTSTTGLAVAIFRFTMRKLKLMWGLGKSYDVTSLHSSLEL